MNELAETLLEAHVKFELARLRGDGLRRLIDEHIGATMAWLADVPLNDLATRDQVIGVIERMVIELRVSGGITELAGEMARGVVQSPASADVTLSQILGRTTYEEFTEKLLALESVRQEVISMAANSNAFASIASRILSHGLLDLLFRSDRTRAEPRSARLSELTSGLLAGVLPEVERQVEEFLGRYIEKHRARIVRDAQRHLTDVVDQDALRSVADEAWDALSTLRLAEAFNFVGARDIEDFVVICYEFWLRFRKTPYFHEIMGELVGLFFDKYGEGSVLALIEDMGVTEQMVKSELETFLGPLLAKADDTGFMEERVRAVLAPFYRSNELTRLLGGAQPQSTSA
ncbi:MAG: hypothetical protein QM778_36230 [Myxococcales bacterium]